MSETTGFKISGIDIYDMKTLSGVEVVSDWAVVKEFDFTQASGTAFVDGTPQAFGDINWTAENLSDYGGAGSYIQFVPGTGLVCHVTGSTGDGTMNVYHASVTAPLLSASVSDIVTDFDVMDTLCFQFLVTSSTNNFPDVVDATCVPCARMFITAGQAGASSGPEWFANFSVENADGTIMYRTTRCGGATTSYTGYPYDQSAYAINVWPTFYELVALPGGGFIGSQAQTGSGGSEITSFPRPLSAVEKSYGLQQEDVSSGVANNPGTLASAPAWELRPSNMKIAMAATATGAGASFGMGATTVFKKLRVLRRRRRD
tara:strand:- start:1049 stop:1996 length:948 start_codon:yes stop_codon:yes gene_type:complete